MINPVRIEVVTPSMANSKIAIDAAALVYRELKDTAPTDDDLHDHALGMTQRTSLALVSPAEEVLATGSFTNTPDRNQKLIVDFATAESQRRIGLGACVISKLEDMAKDQAANRMILWALYDAMPFYADLGYVRQGSSTMHIKDI